MNAFFLKLTTIMLILAGSFYSCQGNDMDFGNIENLYEQPISVIQKCVEGKWKWHAQFGGFVGISYHENTFVDIKNDHSVIDYDDGSKQIFYYTWKIHTIVDHNGMDIKRWVIWDKERDQGIWYFYSIKNNTLSVRNISPSGVTYWEFGSTFVRVK